LIRRRSFRRAIKLPRDLSDRRTGKVIVTKIDLRGAGTYRSMDKW